MEASTAAAAAAHRRVKRAMGLLRAAAGALAPELADVDVIGEAHVETPADADQALRLVRLALHRHGGPFDIVIVASRADGAASSLTPPTGPLNPR